MTVTEAALIALGQMVGTVAFLTARVHRVEKRLDEVLDTHEDLDRRVVTLEGRRATR